MGTAEGMRAYSMDLRERVVAAVDRGMTQEQAAVTFGVSVNTVGRYLTRRRDTGSLAPTAYRHGPRPEKKARLQAWLPARLQQAADATLAEHAFDLVPVVEHRAEQRHAGAATQVIRTLGASTVRTGGCHWSAEYTQPAGDAGSRRAGIEAVPDRRPGCYTPQPP